MNAIILGIVATHVAEIVTALNYKLRNTIFKGDAAFLVACAISLVAATIDVVVNPNMEITSMRDVMETFSAVFAASQFYFMFAVQKLGLDVRGVTTEVTTQGTTLRTSQFPAEQKVRLEQVSAASTTPAQPVGTTSTIPNIQRI